jgi:hypothetical protein
MSPDHNDPRLPAVERLAASRERLRAALYELAPPPEAAGDGSPSVLMTALLAIPGLGLVVDSVRRWWSQHPLHLATLVAGSTARSAMAPVARRSPFALILAAAAIGGLLYWVKPWRGLLKPALLAGLVPHLVARAMDHVPVESWMGAVTTFFSQHARGEGAPDSASDTAPAPEAQAAPVGTPAATSQSHQPELPDDRPDDRTAASTLH